MFEIIAVGMEDGRVNIRVTQYITFVLESSGQQHTACIRV
jgi:hypothetical protein